ncbi:carboxypeptidase-like regulatory domain-containing protein [Mucilaginibacter celer]|uniref:Carboxypeptidase-like regulatory domain-containing protein n=2 Tax=Mucilaginibacter celer TaxID=2305508 RepID=A0A494VSK7_9SPHI|nr:carboxypeptidase-like regulatory domain-containing protein [Mucilaginibacter celer]
MDKFLRGSLSYCQVILIHIIMFSGIVISSEVNAQTPTIIRGTVTDKKSKEPLPAVSVSFVGTTIGTSANSRGTYVLRSNGTPTSVKFSFIGYQSVVKTITPGTEQELNVALSEDNTLLKEVVINAGKKTRYRNKGNPAVELIRQVIAHKNQNRVENYNYAEYHQYEKMVFALSNLSDKFLDKRMFRNYQFLFQQQDSTEIGGKNLLPVYMEEKLSHNFFRKDPYVKKQFIEANKQVKYDPNFVDNRGLSSYFNRMYQDINIYDNNVSMLGNQLLSPIADGAPTFYKFFITDTLKDVSPNLIELSFTPRTTTDLLFEGRIYVTMDGNYAVEKAVLGVNKNINLNFVRQMQATLAFEKATDAKYHLSQSDLKIEFGLNKKKGGGILGERVVMLSNFIINVPRPLQTYQGAAEITMPDATDKDEDYWSKNRPDSLKASEANIYKNIDSLQKIPSFRRTMDLVTLVLAGYKSYGPFEVGPVNTFYNFNPIEGFRLRLGGRTTTTLSKRYYSEVYGAYGFKDQKFKYFVSGTYSLNNKSIYSFPQSYVRLSFQHDTKIPGQELQFVQEDNFLLSFKRGKNDILTYNDVFRFDYVQEFLGHFSYKIGFKKWNQRAAGPDVGGALYFRDGFGNNVDRVQSMEVSGEVRYAPHEKFYQGKLYRTPIPDKYPIFTLRYQQGIKGALGADYRYENFTANIAKRFYLSQLGYADVSTEGGFIGGKVPFPLLDIHHANQSYALQLQSYNLMNFQEFVSDHYAALNIDQNFNGFFFNKIPLLQKLKWREVISYKVLWGGLRGVNDPAKDPRLLQFPERDGVPFTYTLNHGPYQEGSIGIANIFKVLRLDYVERFTYLNHPYAPKNGIRVFIILQF